MSAHSADPNQLKLESVYHKYAEMPTRAASSLRNGALFVVAGQENALDYSQLRHRFKEPAAFAQARRDFEQHLTRLLQKCQRKEKYRQAVKNCEHSYQFLMKIFGHHEEEHNASCWFQMHRNSTNMKNNLLALLEECRAELSSLQQQVQKLEGELEQQRAQTDAEKCRNLELLRTLDDLQGHNTQLRGALETQENCCRQLQQELARQKERNDSTETELKELSWQVQTMGALEDPHRNKRSCLRFSTGPQRRAEDLERFLLVQALGVEELLGE